MNKISGPLLDISHQKVLLDELRQIMLAPHTQQENKSGTICTIAGGAALAFVVFMPVFPGLCPQDYSGIITMLRKLPGATMLFLMNVAMSSGVTLSTVFL